MLQGLSAIAWAAAALFAAITAFSDHQALSVPASVALFVASAIIALLAHIAGNLQALATQRKAAHDERAESENF